MQDEGETTPPVAGSPVDDQPSVFMEEMETPSSSSVAKVATTIYFLAFCIYFMYLEKGTWLGDSKEGITLQLFFVSVS